MLLLLQHQSYVPLKNKDQTFSLDRDGVRLHLSDSELRGLGTATLNADDFFLIANAALVPVHISFVLG